MSEKQKIRTDIMHFLRQRKAAYSQIGNKRLWSITVALIIKFNLIQNYDYWRHCREVCIQWEMLMEIMPSAHGHHSSIRDRMTAQINEWSLIGGTPKRDYERQSRRHAFQVAS